MGLECFKDIWLVDFEFRQPDGERPEPLCLVAREFRTGQLIRLWKEDMQFLHVPPYSIGKDSLFVAYYASGVRGTAGVRLPGNR